MLITVHSFSSVHNTTQNSSDNLPSYLQTNIIAQMLSIGGEGQEIQNKKLSNDDDDDDVQWFNVHLKADLKPA